MARKATKKTVIKDKLPGARKAPAAKPQASYGGWQSIGITHARRAIFGPAGGDLRRDLRPYDRLAMMRKCRWAERNSGLFKQILADLCLYTVGDEITAQSHAEEIGRAHV